MIRARIVALLAGIAAPLLVGLQPAAAFDPGPPPPPAACYWQQVAYASSSPYYEVTVPPNGDGSQGAIHGDITLYAALALPTGPNWIPCGWVNYDAFYVRGSIWPTGFDPLTLEYTEQIRVWLNGTYLGALGIYNHYDTQGTAWYFGPVRGAGKVGADNYGTFVTGDISPANPYPYTNF